MRTMLALLVLAALAAADERVDAVFRVWDRDMDGEITKAELPDEGVFERADKDKNGKLSREEVAGYLGIDLPDPKRKGKKKKGRNTDGGVRKSPRSIPERVEDFFRRFDKNKDGKIQKEELPAVDDETFKRHDRTRDGAWNKREVTRYVKELVKLAKRNPRPENFFDLFDLNRDDEVTKREYDGPAEFFRRYDHDKNRRVTRDEINMGPDAGEMRPGDEKLLADGPTRAPKRGLRERYDADGDGRVTLEELGGAESVMQRLDKNRDGVLTGPELR